MKACASITRLLLPLVALFAAAVAEAQVLPDLDARSKAAMREAAGSTSLDPWQRLLMLRLAGGEPRTFVGDSVRQSHAGGPISLTSEGTWTVIPTAPPTAPPPPRVTPTGVYDSARRRMIVFGGTGPPGLMNDVWALKLDHPFNWTQLLPSGTSPEVRRLHGAIYDPVRDRMIVFGGSGASSFLNDTWALQFTGATGASWSQLAPLGPLPALRCDFATIYDPNGDRMLVFGGFDGVSPPSSRRSDLWQLSLSGSPQWTELSPGAGPSARSGHRAAYDPVRQRMIVYGGYDVNFVSDTWALALVGAPAWTNLAPPGALPGARVEHAVEYEPSGDRLVIYGGYDDPNNTHVLGDAWALPLGSPQPWALVSSGGPERWGFAVIHDPIRHEMVVFGGIFEGLGSESLTADTFALELFDRPTWSYYPNIYGPAVVTPSAVYDPTRQRMVVFGGAQSDYYNEVWVLTLGAVPGWMQLDPTGPLPPKRRLHAAVYDQATDRMIVFGGFDGTNRNDTWSLQFSGATGAAWSQILPAGPLPPGRADFGMVLDPVEHRLVAFGGYDGVSPPAQRRGDLWTLDLDGPPAWIQLALPGAPTARSGHRAIYDAPRHRMVLFGGYDTFMLNDTWALTLGATPAWSAISAAGPLPYPRADHVLAFDSRRDRMVLQSGYDGIASFADVWVLPLTGPPAWIDITPFGGPGYRWGSAGIYDWLYDRLVVFGGSDYDPRAHALTWDAATSTLLALQSVEARPGLVRLVWRGSGSEAFTATVYRRENGTGWRVLGRAESDAGGSVVWEDREVVAGMRYEYRLGVLESGREIYLGATSAIVPSGIELGVSAISPAIAAGRLALWCSAPSPGPVRLELVDLAGRRIAIRELDWASAGARQVDIAPAPPSGIYVARLSQGGHSAGARVSVIH